MPIISKADRKERLQLDLEAFQRFGISVSGLKGIAPNNPESYAAFMIIQNGIPWRIATQPLVDALDKIREAGVKREIPLTILTIQLLTQGKIWIEKSTDGNHIVVARSEEIPFDLTNLIDALIAS